MNQMYKIFLQSTLNTTIFIFLIVLKTKLMRCFKRSIWILPLIAFLAFFSNCRKQEIRDDFADPEVSELCTNGILDEGEDWIDCGGECAPCSDQVAPCVLANNSIHLEGFVVDANPDVISTSLIIDGSSHEYKALTQETGTHYLRIVFNEEPKAYKIYTGTTSEFVHDNEVYVEYRQGSSLRKGEGDVYVISEGDGAYTIMSCDYGFYDESLESVPEETQTFKVTF